MDTKPRAHSIVFWIMAWLVLAALVAPSPASALPISITPQQKERLKSLADTTRDKTRRERDLVKRARAELFQAYRSYDLDEHKAKAAREKISKSQVNLLEIHFDNQVSLRQILSADQFQQLRSLAMRGHGRDRQGRSPGIPGLGPDQSPFDGLPDKRMLDAIDAKPDQARRLRAVLSPDAKAIQKLQTDSAQMLQIYSRYDLDTAAAKKLIESIHQDQRKLSAINHKRQLALRSILTRDQFDRFQAEIDRRIRDEMSRHRGRTPFRR